jgi:dimeric dUTPase (all-alpha-NTP-PPase superfamily)
MNITDVKEVKIKGDMLEAIFKQQMQLEQKYNQIEKKKGALVPETPLDLNTFYGQERVRLLIYRITEELYEAGNCMRNKAWKQSEVPIDINHFLEEISDAVHFLVQLYIELGLDAVDFSNLYFSKAEVNKFRQDTRY